MDTLTITPQQYYTLILPGILIALPILYGVAAYLWNKKLVPARRAKAKATPTLGKIIGDYLTIAFKENNKTLLPKKIENKTAHKLASLTTINWLLITATLGLLAVHTNGLWTNAWVPALALTASIWLTGNTPINQRKQLVNRMFAVAASTFRYGRGAELQPWKYVNVKKWNGKNPAEIQVSLPPEYDSSSQQSKENFQRHFNNTITDENTWIYDWDAAKGYITVKPIGHIPTRAPYPGSENHKWSEIPLGIGVDGEVTVDLTLSPHVLLTGITGSGKLVDISQLLFTLNRGWTTVGEITDDDWLFGVDGQPVKVKHVHPIITPEKAYKIRFKNGEEIITDAEHLWVTESRLERVSRFKLDNKEDSRKRDWWLSKETTQRLEKLLTETSNDETISIKEIATLCGKFDQKLRGPSNPIFYRIAEEIGVAEQVTETYVFHYKAQTFEQYQNTRMVDADEFMKLYNADRQIPTVSHPLTNLTFEKLKEIERELRETDTMSFEDIINHCWGTHKKTRKWLEDNYSPELSTKQAVTALIRTAEETRAFSPLPTKIYDFGDKKRVMSRDFADLCGITDISNTPEGKKARAVFDRLARKAKSTKIERVKVKVITGGYETKKQGEPVNKYPKKLFIKRILEHASTPINDQRENRIVAKVRTTEEILGTLHVYGSGNVRNNNHSIARANPVELPDAILPIAPYVLGAWLGDGYTATGSVCGEDPEVFEYIEHLGYTPTEVTRNSIPNPDNANFRSMTYPALTKVLRDNKISSPSGWRVKRDGEWKHIPDAYFSSSVEQRRELLRGLLDTDGTVDSRGSVSFATSNARLKTDVKKLIASLGYIPKISQKQPTYTYKGEKLKGKTAYIITFEADPVDRLFHLERKNKAHAERYTGNKLNHSLAENHFIESIEEVPGVPMRCISVDSEDRQFLVGESFIPTHNSVLQRNMIFHCIQHNDAMRFLGVDIKRVELSPFKKYAQTVMGIGTNLEDGVDIVRYVKRVMEKRYEMMEELGINNFKDMRNPDGTSDYAIMLMIDEAYMFMAPSGGKSDEAKAADALHGEASSMLGEIARLGRAAGIHLVMATQRPDAKVIYGELKLNLPIRIAAGRLDSTASGMTLDSASATYLPAIKGRGIVSIYGVEQQFQGYFAEQDWIDEWLQAHPGVEPTLYPKLEGGSNTNAVPGDLEEVLEEGGFDFEDGELDGPAPVITGETATPLEEVKNFLGIDLDDEETQTTQTAGVTGDETTPAGSGILERPQEDTNQSNASSVPASFAMNGDPLDSPLPGLEDPKATYAAPTPWVPEEAVTEPPSDIPEGLEGLSPDLLKLIMDDGDSTGPFSNAGKSDKPEQATATATSTSSEQENQPETGDNNQGNNILGQEHNQQGTGLEKEAGAAKPGLPPLPGIKPVSGVPPLPLPGKLPPLPKLPKRP